MDQGCVLRTFIGPFTVDASLLNFSTLNRANLLVLACLDSRNVYLQNSHCRKRFILAIFYTPHRYARKGPSEQRVNIPLDWHAIVAAHIAIDL